MIFHRGAVVAEHPELPGKYQLRILPEHGPGAIARTARRVRSSRSSTSHAPTPFAEVEIRDLTVYEALLRPRRGDTDIAPPPEIAPPEGTERVADDGVSVHHEDAAGLPSGAWS